MGSRSVTLSLDVSTAIDLSIELTLTGTATDGTDYTVSPDPITIAAGQDSATLSFSVTSDTLFEIDETNVAGYGRLTYQLNDAATLQAGARLEYVVQIGQTSFPDPRNPRRVRTWGSGSARNWIEQSNWAPSHLWGLKTMLSAPSTPCHSSRSSGQIIAEPAHAASTWT